MPAVDLRLAVNYIPALECLVKSACMACSLTLLHAGQHLSVYLMLSILLHLDRIVSKPLIFDGNSILCCLLASWVINNLRLSQESPVYLTETLTFVWICFSFSLVLEPKCLQEHFALYTSGHTLRHVAPSLITSVIVCLASFTHAAADSSTVLVLRALTFTALCVSWVYIVGVWRPRPRCQSGGLCTYGTQCILVRFCPVLFIYPVLVAVYACISLALFLYHYSQIHHAPSAAPAPALATQVSLPLLPPAQLQDVVIESIPEEGEDEDEDVLAFRAACQSLESKGAGMRSI